MTTRIIQGVVFLVVPSIGCRSVAGRIRCSQYHTGVACHLLKCEGPPVCFITQEQYPEWLKAKLIGHTDATQ